MTLRLNKTYNLYVKNSKSLEKISQDMTMLNIDFEGDIISFDDRPAHMRFEFGACPPLDISFDSVTGLLKEITVFIEDDKISRNVRWKQEEFNTENGYPCFDINMLEKHQYYYEETCELEIILYESILVICKLNQIPYKQIFINEEVYIYLNSQNQFIGVQVNNLSSEDLKLLIF